MVDKKVSFRYFNDPYAFSSYLEEPSACPICERVVPGFEGPFKGEDRLSFVCVECLDAGKLAEKGVETNEGDATRLREQIRSALSAATPAEEIERTLQAKTLELTLRTPRLLSWKDILWPAHCGDYCRFLKEAGKTDYRRFAAGKDPKAFFLSTIRDIEDADEEYLWEGMRSDSPRDASNPYSLAFYLFQCGGCGRYVTLWDED